MVYQVLAVLAVGLSLVPQNAGAPLAKELDQFQGEWMLIETADEKRPDLGDPAIRMIIKGNQVVMKLGAATTNDGRVVVGHVKMVRTIDMDFGEGNVVQGVYDLKGEVLIMCFDEAGKTRPGSLIPKGTQWVEKWQKVKP